MTDTRFSDLVRKIHEAKRINVKLVAAEVGPETWKLMLDTCEAGTGRKWPEGEKETVKEGYMMGIKIRPADVPEWQIWPLSQ